MTDRDDLGADDWLNRCRELFLTDLWSLLVDEDERVDGYPLWHDPSGRGGEPRGRPIPARLPGQPLYARLAVAQALAGDRFAAIKTWRAATGDTSAKAKAAIDALLNDAQGTHIGS